MNRFMHIFSYCIFFLVIVLTMPSAAEAHGTAYKVLSEAATKAVTFSYSDGEPMAYAEVLVFGPQDSEIEHQNGRTDKHGTFAFCPDMPGAWRIIAKDGMGHRCEATVAAGPDRPDQDTAGSVVDSAAPENPVRGSTLLKAIAGVSLILNLGFGVYFLRRRSKGAERKTNT